MLNFYDIPRRRMETFDVDRKKRITGLYFAYTPHGEYVKNNLV